MALKGNLRDISISQLLNLINIAQKTGTLVVEGPEAAIKAFFREGKLAYCQEGDEDRDLVSILAKFGSLSTTQFRQLKPHTKQMSDKELGLYLISNNYISQLEILSKLQTHYIEILNQLFSWTEASFHFETNLYPPEGKIILRISLENVILEGVRRQKEWGHLQDEIPSLDIALKFAERPSADLQNVKLNLDEWQVVTYVHPKNTVRRIARVTRHTDLEIRQIVYRLLEAGLIELVRPVGASAAASSGQPRIPLSPEKKEERKSLINRIIGRIRSL
jgi:hypothetical protein